MEFAKYASESGDISIRTSLHHGELHMMARCTNPNLDFRQQLFLSEKAIRDTAGKIQGEYHPVFVRYFISDIANQDADIENIWGCAISVVGQAPADGTKLAIWAHFSLQAQTSQIAPNFWKTICGRNTYYRYSNHHATADSSYTLTRKMMEQYVGLLQNQQCSLEDNCVRTWFFVRDIDTNYKGLVIARNEVFDTHSLIPSTHFIASTGIGGTSRHHHTTVALDSLAIKNISDFTVKYLQAAEHLNRTSEYGVAFERGTLLQNGDNRLVLISGTASINNKGEILYPGDIKRQFARATENILALLQEGGTTWQDVNHIIIYLRDPADYHVVKQLAEEKFESQPYVIVQAPVCRPGWLIELECAAEK